MQFLEFLLVLLVNVLILPWDTAVHIILAKNSFVVFQTITPGVWYSINVFDACNPSVSIVSGMVSTVHIA